MNQDRRHFLSALTAAAFAPATLVAQSRQASAKKGWAGDQANLHRLFGAHWYYTWWTGGNGSKDAKVVPMHKRAEDIGKLGEIERLQGIDHLLGYPSGSPSSTAGAGRSGRTTTSSKRPCASWSAARTPRATPTSNRARTRSPACSKRTAVQKGRRAVPDGRTLSRRGDLSGTADFTACPCAHSSWSVSLQSVPVASRLRNHATACAPLGCRDARIFSNIRTQKKRSPVATDYP